MKCTNCGSEVPKGNKFCGNCGASVNTTSILADISEEEELKIQQSVYNQQTRNEQSVQPYMNPLFPEVSPEDRRKKKSPADFIAIAIGILLIYLGISGSAIISSFGLLLVCIGLFEPVKTNYCPNCNTMKDFSAKTCPKCGKRFSMPIGSILAITVIVMVGTAIVYMIKMR